MGICKTTSEKAEIRKQLETDQRIQQWILVGITVYDFAQRDLDQVVEKLGKLGFIPNGYLYPELHLAKTAQRDFSQMLERKARHQK